MGYTKRDSITDFWPDDDENTIYRASCGYSLQDLIDISKEKWPDAELCDLEITAEKIHTHCIYYDLYDPSDYTDFIIITRTKR